MDTSEFLARLSATMAAPVAAVPRKAPPADTARLSDMVAQIINEARAAHGGEALSPAAPAADSADALAPVSPSGGIGLLNGNEAYVSIDRMAIHHRSQAGKLRVAAYIRVSSENPDQEDSYENQDRYFTKLLNENENWTSAGVYADYGISATSEKRRVGFQRLLRHGAEGKIDRIVCKSISRFARNTGDFMKALQVLRNNAVTIFFEKENLDTADPTSEFILTTLGAIAQEESRSISENIRWGYQKRYPRGEARNYAIYGYRFAGDGKRFICLESGFRLREIEIVADEARIVRRIFQEIAAGKRYIDVARRLNLEKIPAPTHSRLHPRSRVSVSRPPVKGKLREGLELGWTGAQIAAIVHQEKYAGDMALQKTYTPDFLTHKSRKNTGEVPRYYVEDHHPAIISRELFQAAREAADALGIPGSGGPGDLLPLSRRLICPYCGKFYYTRNRRRSPIWFCPSSAMTNGKRVCSAEKVYEEQIVCAFRQAVLERFSLLNRPSCGDAVWEDIIRGACALSAAQGALFSPGSDSFVGRIIARLEHFQRTDSVERDRSLLKRQIAALRIDARPCPSQPEVTAVFGEAEAKIAALTEQLSSLERYWEEMEADYEWREAALTWLRTLPEGRQGTVDFLRGVTDIYLKAFVLSITVHSPRRFTFHWFDDVRTEVRMSFHVRDFRNPSRDCETAP